MIDTLLNSNKLRLDKNKNLLKLKSNQGLNYFTSSVTFQDDSSKYIFISRIDEYINKRKDDFKYKMSNFYNDASIKSLNKLKKKLKINSQNKIVNGRKLRSPNKEHKIKFFETLNLLRTRKENYKNIINYGKFNIETKETKNIKDEKLKSLNYKLNSNVDSLMSNNYAYFLFIACHDQDDELNEKIHIIRKHSLDYQLSKEKQLTQGFIVFII